MITSYDVSDSDMKVAVALIDESTDCKQTEWQVLDFVQELFGKTTLGFRDRFWANYLLFTSKR